jgi:hypothetical protein
MRNLKIDKKRKRAELELRYDFYPERVIRKVADDFRKVADIRIKKMDENMIVTLNLKVSDLRIEEMTYNFINYLLAEVKNNRAGL